MNTRPSSLNRLAGCPGSLALAHDLPRQSSPHASEGKRLHRLMEQALGAALEDEAPTHDEAELVGTALDLVALGRILALEEPLPTSSIHPALSDGTADVVSGAAFDLGYLTDWKFGGRQQAPAHANLQLAAYAVAAADDYQFDAVTVQIVYPRLRLADRATYDADALDRAGDRIRLVIDAALAPMAPLRPGPWCRYCPALATCPAATMGIRAMAEIDGDISPANVADASLPALLDMADLAQGYANAVRQIAHARLATGHELSGWHLKETRRRRWPEGVNAEKLARAFASTGVPRLSDKAPVTADDLTAPPTIKSPAQVEKVVGRSLAARDVIDQLVDYSVSTSLTRKEDPTP